MERYTQRAAEQGAGEAAVDATAGAPASGASPAGAPVSSAPASGAPVSSVPAVDAPTPSISASGVPTSGDPASGVPASGRPAAGPPPDIRNLAYAALAASLDDAFCVACDVRCDAAGRCTGFRHLDANPAYRALAPDADGWTSAAGGPPAAWADALGRVARGGPAERFECALPDGACWYDVHVFPVPGAPGGTVGVRCRDVSARERMWVTVERARAEAALRAGAARLRQMLQIPTVGIVHFDRAGAVVQANDAFLAITGCPRAALDAGRLRYDELAPPDWDGDGGEQARSRPFERAWLRPDGRRVWLLCAATRLDAHVVAEFVIDVTDRRAAQEQLRDSELRYRAFSSLVPVMMWQTDADGRRVTPNQRWLEYTGQCVEDTRHGGWVAAIHPDDLPQVEHTYADAIAAGVPFELEFRIRGADGRHRWFLARQLPVRDASGAVEAWYGAAIDIDARRQAEAALQESEGRFRALADAAPALIWQFGPDGRLAYVNQRYAEVTDTSIAELLPDGWRAGVHPDDLPYFLAAAGDALGDRVPFHLRLRVRVRGGHWRWFEVHFAPWFAPDGAYRGHVGIGIDITDGVQAEDALREADRRKDEFLAVLAHELRNPLAPISNAVQMLRCADGKRKADRVMEMASRQVKHITRLVDDLMEVSRITRGKIELARQPLLLADILGAAVETSRPALDGARHAFTLALPDERLLLDADKVRLTQVFSNLLNNAAKYTDPGGRITLQAWREDDEAVVAVRDSGIGIPADKLGQVFGMFAQVEEAGARSQGGLGIGLAMVHKLVQMHGGRVEARSEGPGRGSEFVVRLPLLAAGSAPAAPPRREAPARDGRPLAHVRVLVVDDNRDAADSLCLLLGSLGADAHCTYGGAEALRCLAVLRPDAVVLDIGMPDMDGYAVARAIRADPRHAGLRLIALTGWGQEGDRERTRASGFDHHLTKPVDLAALQRLLAEGVREAQAAG